MGFIAIDHPDEVIHWFASEPESERRRKAVGDCPHDCPHFGTTVVGWGPDEAHYELVTCDDANSCNGNCRAWMDGRGRASGWKLLGPTA